MRTSILTAAAGARSSRESRRRFARAVAAVTAGALLTVTAGGAAVADDVYNTIDGQTAGTALDIPAESMVFKLEDGDTKTTTLRLQQRNSATQPSTTNPDTWTGCNATVADPAKFTLLSSDSAVAQVTPGDVAFTACTPADGTNADLTAKTITVTRGKPGTSTITVKVADDNEAPGGFLLSTATFVVTVEAPPAAKPVVEVVGLDDPAVYTKGKAPSPSCLATHPDTDREVPFPAVVYKAEPGDDGLGTWIVKCLYVEKEGAPVIPAQRTYEMVDLTPPAVEPALYVNGNRVEPTDKWLRGEIRVQWGVRDVESPSSLKRSGCEDASVLEDVKERTITCTATSWYNPTTRQTLTTTKTLTISRDGTAPVVTGTVSSPTVDVNGVTWHKGQAVIEWDASDPLSGVDWTTMKSTVPWAPLDGTTTTLGQGRRQLSRVVVSDLAGNVGAGSISGINVDGSGPVVETEVETDVAHDDGSRTWYKDSATVRWTATDPDVTPYERGSGVAGPSSGTATVDESGPYSVEVKDNVGNDGSSDPEELAIDTLAPEVTVKTTRDPDHTADGSAFFKDGVAVEVDATDPAEATLGTGSGIESEDDPSGEHEVTRSGAFSVTARDNVGHETTSAPLDISIDATAPLVSAKLPSAPHNDGTLDWYKDSVEVAVTSSDPQGGEGERASGLDPVSDSGTRAFTTAGKHTFTAQARDNVGHQSEAKALSFAVDTAAPKVKIVCPPTVVKGTSAKAGWAASDERGGSGLATPYVGTVRLDTSVVGLQTVNAPVAQDKVGHAATATCSSRVVYAFKGFFSPIDNGGVYNRVKAGAAVPVKFSLGGNQGLQVLSGPPVATPVSCSTRTPVDDLEQVVLAATTSGLTYDAPAGQYVYTWKTATAMANTCQKLTVKLADGTSHTALFKFVR